MWTLSGFADEISPDLELQCSVLNELGIRFIEFRSAWGENVLDLDDRRIDEVRNILDHHGIRTSSIGSPIGKVSVTDDFDAHLQRFDRALEVAGRLDAPYIRIFSFYMPADNGPEFYREEVLRRMAALTQRAEKREMTLLHENEKNIYGDIPSRCLDIVESVGSPRLRVAWDAANFVQCGVRPFSQAFTLLRPYLEYVQVKDAVLADGHVVPAGEGDGQLPETLRALRDDGFDGFFSMEPHLPAVGGHTKPDMFRLATKAFEGLLVDQGIDYQ